MSKPKVFEKPIGVKDILPALVLRKRHIERLVQQCLQRWGYEEIITPTLEYYDTVGGASSTLDDKLFKLLDRNGKSLVLRPDMTAPIARVVASLLKEKPLPIRLAYHANVFRAQTVEAGRDAEFAQTGVELVGDGSSEADAEVIALTIAALQSAGIDHFKIAIGHVGFLEGLFDDCLPDANHAQLLKERLLRRDYVGYREAVKSFALTVEVETLLTEILSLKGDRISCQRALDLAPNTASREGILNLCEVWDSLEAYGVSQFVVFDFTLISNFNYYTGMIFEGYAADLGFPVCSGGRYDNLLGQFGRPAPATGFALKMDRILEISSVPEETPCEKIVIAYTNDFRKEAIAEAKALRETTDAVVITHRVEESQEISEIEAIYGSLVGSSVKPRTDVKMIVFGRGGGKS